MGERRRESYVVTMMPVTEKSVRSLSPKRANGSFSSPPTNRRSSAFSPGRTEKPARLVSTAQPSHAASPAVQCTSRPAYCPRADSDARSASSPRRVHWRLSRRRKPSEFFPAELRQFLGRGEPLQRLGLPPAGEVVVLGELACAGVVAAERA